MKKNKTAAILVSLASVALCVGLMVVSISAAQTDSRVDTSAIADETSATEPPPESYNTDNVQRNIYVTEEELKAQASNVLEELNTEQDCNSGDAIARKRAKAIAKSQAEAKQDVRAYDVMEKYNSDFKQDVIITDKDKDIECMRSMVELLNKNIVTDSEKELLVQYVERRTNWLYDDIKLKEEFLNALDNVK